MEEETKDEAIEKKASELTEATTGKAFENLGTESPLDEVRKLNRENKELRDEMRNIAEKFEKAAANLVLGGRAQAGQETKKMTEEEKIKAEADKYLNLYKL